MKLSAQLRGRKHLFIDSVHQHHVCQHSSCKDARTFDRIMQVKGADFVAVHISKRESFRLYDRRWPYDMASRAVPLEAVQDIMGETTDQDDLIDGEASAMKFKDSLTPMQRYVAERLEEGYRPREIALMLGKPNSGSVRFHKHMVKQKAAEWFGR